MKDIKQTLLLINLCFFMIVPCLAQKGKIVPQNEPIRYFYHLSGIVLDEKAQPMQKTAVCFYPASRPLSGRVPCTLTDDKGNYNLMVKDIPDKYTVCASNSKTVFVLKTKNYRSICSEPLTFGEKDEKRTVDLKFRIKKA